ncbi:hypothetical protein BH10PSE12_BH10PSE12_02970 [soil metagenome]
MIAAKPQAGSAPRFAIGPLSWGIALGDFEAWLVAADAGQEIVYAGGPAMPHGMAVVAAVTEATKAGDVRAHTRRVEGRIEYFAVRRRPEVMARTGRGARDAIAAHSVAGQIFAHLIAAAAAERPCPTNPELARTLGLKDAEAARYGFNQLVAGGRIMVANNGPRMRRIVTIVASGQTTARGKI